MMNKLFIAVIDFTYNYRKFLQFFSFNDYGERDSRLSSRMYLPDRDYDADRAPEPRSLHYKSRSFDDGLSDHGRRAYVKGHALLF